MKGFIFALLIMVSALCAYMLEDSYGMITSIKEEGWEIGTKETVNNLLHSEVFDLSEKKDTVIPRAVESEDLLEIRK